MPSNLDCHENETKRLRIRQPDPSNWKDHVTNYSAQNSGRFVFVSHAHRSNDPLTLFASWKFCCPVVCSIPCQAKSLSILPLSEIKNEVETTAISFNEVIRVLSISATQPTSLPLAIGGKLVRRAFWVLVRAGRMKQATSTTNWTELREPKQTDLGDGPRPGGIVSGMVQWGVFLSTGWKPQTVRWEEVLELKKLFIGLTNESARSRLFGLFDETKNGILAIM